MSLLGIPLVMALLTGAFFMADPPMWWQRFFASGFTGGCGAFVVYAQNRWEPYGAAIRAEPSVRAKQIGSYDPNQVIAVDGWVHAEVAYPTNSAPYNSDVWFHLANEPGWVSFGGGARHAHDPRSDRPGPERRPAGAAIGGLRGPDALTGGAGVVPATAAAING
jgi:hypothetical protein